MHTPLGSRRKTRREKRTCVLWKFLTWFRLFQMYSFYRKGKRSSMKSVRVRPAKKQMYSVPCEQHLKALYGEKQKKTRGVHLKRTFIIGTDTYIYHVICKSQNASAKRVEVCLCLENTDQDAQNGEAFCNG